MKKFICSIVVVIFILSMADLVLARGGRDGSRLGMPRHQWWQNEKIVNELDLSEDQISKINKISQANRRQLIKLRSEIQLVTLDLEAVMDAKDFDLKKAKAIVDKIDKIRSQMGQQKMNGLLEIRNVLTQDQYLKLKLKGKQRGRKHGRGGRDQGPGQD